MPRANRSIGGVRLSENATPPDSLNRLPVDVGLYADIEHNPQRLVRKAGVPALTDFRIINTYTGENFSNG